jgi:hypothetical protein
MEASNHLSDVQQCYIVIVFRQGLFDPSHPDESRRREMKACLI